MIADHENGYPSMLAEICTLLMITAHRPLVTDHRSLITDH